MAEIAVFQIATSSMIPSRYSSPAVSLPKVRAAVDVTDALEVLDTSSEPFKYALTALPDRVTKT